VTRRVGLGRRKCEATKRGGELLARKGKGTEKKSRKIEVLNRPGGQRVQATGVVVRGGEGISVPLPQKEELKKKKRCDGHGGRQKTATATTERERCQRNGTPQS